MVNNENEDVARWICDRVGKGEGNFILSFMVVGRADAAHAKSPRSHMFTHISSI